MKKLLLIAVLITAQTNVFALSRMTEEELFRNELSNPAKEGRLSKDQLYGRYPQVAYMESFNAKKKELDQKAMDPNFQAKSGDAAVAGKTTGAIWTYHTVFAANPFSSTGIGLGYATAGFLLFDLLTADRTDSNARSKSISDLQHPSLYLVRELVGVGNISKFDYPSDEVMRSNQRQTVNLIDNLGLGCEPAAWHIEGQAGVGNARPDVSYKRLIVCGFKEGEEVPWSWGGSDEIMLAQTLSLSHVYLRGVSMISLPQLDSKPRFLANLGIKEGDDASIKNAGILAYEKIKDKIGGWTAVYTGKDPEGKWSAFVSRNGETMIFPIPEK